MFLLLLKLNILFVLSQIMMENIIIRFCGVHAAVILANGGNFVIHANFSVYVNLKIMSIAVCVYTVLVKFGKHYYF